MLNRRVIVLLTVCLLASITSADIKTDMDALTGAKHTRVVWLNGGDRINGGGKLMGYDSRTNQTTQILAAATGQNRPVFCSGGNRVIVSINYKVNVVDWDGSNKRYLVDGVCSDAWVDPSTGKEWFVARTGAKSTSGKLYRYLLEDPSQKFLLYDARQVGIDYFQWWQISPDGKMAVDFLPWSKCYVIDDGGLKANGTATMLSDGCWSSVVKDNSRFWYHLTCCPHKTLKVFKYKTFVKEVAINAGPRPSGTKSDEFYHPKSASKGAQFMTVTGGYFGNSGSNSAEVYLGKWNTTFTAFDGWVRLTENSNADYTPDAWVGVDAQGPSISLSADTLKFTAVENGAAPAAKSVTVTTPSGALEGLTVQSNQQWLAAQVSGSGASFTIANTANPAGLAAQVHTATVTVRATNANPPTRTYTVLLTVTGTPKATSLALTPTSATVAIGATRQFTASVLDQYGAAVAPQPIFSWSVAGGCGTVSGGGLFTAGAAAGTCTLKVAAGTLSAKAAIVVTANTLPLRITSRLEGKTFGVGQKVVIAFSATSSISGVVLEVSPDGGKNYYPILSNNAIQPSDAAWTSGYTWTIPASVKNSDGNAVSLLSDQVMIKAYNYSGEENDVTGPFTILVPFGVVGAPRLAPHLLGDVTLWPSGTITVAAGARTTVRLYSPTGALVNELRAREAQSVSWSMQRMPAGAYLLDVAGPARVVRRTVVWAR